MGVAGGEILPLLAAGVGASKGQRNSARQEINIERLYFVDTRRDQHISSPPSFTPLRRARDLEWVMKLGVLPSLVLLSAVAKKWGRESRKCKQVKDEDGTDRCSVGATRAAAASGAQRRKDVTRTFI